MSGAVSVGEAMQSLGAVDTGRIKRLLEGGIKIPPQPRVLEELRQQTLRKQFDVRVLSRIIGQDPGISAMLFKVVTNAAYHQHQRFPTYCAEMRLEEPGRWVQLASELYYREQRVPNPEWDLIKHEVLPELGLNEEALLEFADIVMERYHGEACAA